MFSPQHTAAAAVNDGLTYPALVIGDAVAQTKKHDQRAPRRARRRAGDPITAMVDDAISDGTGVRVPITWSRHSGSASGTEDALDLARRCVQEWQQFFAHHGLNPS